MTDYGAWAITSAVISVFRRARTSIAGLLVAALTVIATQAPVVAHAASHWIASSHEHSHGDAVHRHKHDAQHDHEVRLQKVPLSVVPAAFIGEFGQRLTLVIVLTTVAASPPEGIVSDGSWNVRGPPLPLSRSYPPAYSTAPPAV